MAWALTMSARKIAMPVERFSFLMVLGFIAAFLSHRLDLTSAGCIWNDIFDRDFDAQVDRTKNRPLASGQVSITGAFVFLCVHMVILLSMIWEVNPLAWKVGLLALFPLTGVYPFMKRITYWPQAWLGIYTSSPSSDADSLFKISSKGLAINIGISMAWATTTETIPISSIVLSVGCFLFVNIIRIPASV
ncbi:hypothetical protein H0H93_013783 [Arthromyces matolae]|nr:hypothetical protein H0H93_013783 [Arthromyces matolae]